MSSFIVTIYLLLSSCISQTYILTEQNLPFSDSAAYCSFTCDTNLASIHNDSQNNEAKALTTFEHTWIGLTKANSQGAWTWNDNSPLNFGNDTSGGVYPWSNEYTWSQPDGTGDCAALYANNKDWDDSYCTSAFPSLCNYPTPIHIFNDDSDYQRIPSYNNIIGTIDILDEIYIEFDFIINSWNYTLHQWTCILLIGTDSLRMPGIYIDNGGKFLHPTWINVDTGEWLSSGINSLELNILYHFEFYATQNWIKTTLNSSNGYIVIADSKMDSHSIWNDFNIYMSGESTWNDPSDVNISGLKITTSNTYNPNSFNYLCDYNHRFIKHNGSLIGDWSFDNNTCYVTQSDANHAISQSNSIWMGLNNNNYNANSLNWTDYKVEVVMNIQSGWGISLLVRSQVNSSYVISLSSFSQQIKFMRFDAGESSVLTSKSITIIENVDYTLRVEVSGSSFNIYLDNVWQFQHINSDFTKGSIGLSSQQATAIYKSLRIMFPSDSYLYTINPTQLPSNSPSISPSLNPSLPPSISPSNSPTISPSNSPTFSPSISPSNFPTISPSNSPTFSPSNFPSLYPSNIPSISPSNSPSLYPTISPSIMSISPSIAPSNYPSFSPTFSPSIAPSTPEGGVNDISTTDSADDKHYVNNNNNKKDNSLILFIIIGSCVIMFLLCLICYCIYLRNKKQKTKKETHNEMNEMISTNSNIIKMTPSKHSISLHLDETDININQNFNRIGSMSNTPNMTTGAVMSDTDNNNNNNNEGENIDTAPLPNEDDISDTDGSDDGFYASGNTKGNDDGFYGRGNTKGNVTAGNVTAGN